LNYQGREGEPTDQGKSKGTEKNEKIKAIANHMKCAKTANGLTHFVMYGDVPRKNMPL